MAKGADCKSAVLRLRRFESFFPHQPSLAKREKAATPKPKGRRRAVACELRLGKPATFARAAREGCRAEAQRAQAGCGRELRLGKPIQSEIGLVLANDPKAVGIESYILVVFESRG